MADIIVREATPEDVADIRRVGEAGWRAAYDEILTRDTIDAAMAAWYDAETVRGYVDREDVACFVAERDGVVVGYLTGGPDDEEGVATLGAFYVDPACWNEGVGTALLERFESCCRRHGCVRLQFRVLSGNDVGRSFYRARGYVGVDERERDLFGETVTECVFAGRLD